MADYPSRSPAPKQAGNTRPTCRRVVDEMIAPSSAHKSMSGKCMLDMFGGPGFEAEATNTLGLRGSVIDTKFGL